jgi:DNA-directed RNA polymerase specialized sigma24 family protein
MKPVDTANAILDEIDSAALYKRLSTYARSLAREMPDVFDGISPKDLVGETFVAYLSAESGLNWDPTRSSLERFLCGVLKNKFLMHVRRSKLLPASAENGPFLAELPNPAIMEERASDTVDRLKIVARGDRELEELIDAAQGLETVSKVNQQLSERLNITVPDVVNRKKRLVRRLKEVAGETRGCVHSWSKLSL